MQQLTFEEVHHTHIGDANHNHSGYSRSSLVEDLRDIDPSEPNMHSHAIHTNGLAFHVDGSTPEYTP